MKLVCSTFFALFISAAPAFCQVINLKGSWKFHVGDNNMWASPQFDDSRWESIYAPAAWEDEGFNNYDGFAWYRKKFDGSKLNKETSYYLNLGYIDDCDEVYLNGILIAVSGIMPPKFKTAYNSERKYPIPPDVLRYDGNNILAIRVYDVVGGGGIVDGAIGIYRMEKFSGLLINLSGLWQFATSFDERPIKDESSWKKIMVPFPWERQGYSKYDGFAWYRKTFSVPSNLPNEPLVLLLGRIDDFDKVYLNGQLIGTTNDHRDYGSSNSYTVDRIYDIPAKLLKRAGPNVIEVLVEDMGNWGGIYEGDVGIALKEHYRRRWTD